MMKNRRTNMIIKRVHLRKKGRIKLVYEIGSVQYKKKFKSASKMQKFINK